MANYKAIAQIRPEVREYIKARKWVHRGETLSYGPNIDVGCLTTDGAGFRKSVFGGEKRAVAEIVQGGSYGIVTGPSNVYGFGLPSDADTIPSLLGAAFSMPFANISLPEGHSRNLFAICMNITATAKRPPSVIVHLSGGDFTGWAYTGVADPVFGPPNLYQGKSALAERGGRRPPADQGFRAMAHASILWMRALLQLCRGNNIPLVLGNDTTFFEKTEPSDYDRQCALGEGMGQAQSAQFAVQRSHGAQYYDRRAQFAANAGVPLVGPGKSAEGANAIGFVDEFHYDADGSAALTRAFSPEVERALKGKSGSPRSA
jgi:hypothetical protein